MSHAVLEIPEPTFSEKVEQAEKSYVQEMLRILNEYEPSDHDAFSGAIQCLEKLGLSRREIADYLNATQATVSRWATGKSVPPFYSRQAIVKRLADLVASRRETAR